MHAHCLTSGDAVSLLAALHRRWSLGRRVCVLWEEMMLVALAIAGRSPDAWITGSHAPSECALLVLAHVPKTALWNYVEQLWKAPNDGSAKRSGDSDRGGRERDRRSGRQQQLQQWRQWQQQLSGKLRASPAHQWRAGWSSRRRLERGGSGQRARQGRQRMPPNSRRNLGHIPMGLLRRNPGQIPSPGQLTVLLSVWGRCRYMFS